MGDSAANPTSDPRVDRRADALLPEEEAAGTDDAAAQAQAVLAESDARGRSRETTPDEQLETRTSEEATPPPP
jgi:hypothetical protein